MTNSYYRWKRLLIFSSGLFLGTAFCMKWMEGDFVSGKQAFTIIGLELSYSIERVQAILSTLDPRVWTILRYHLYFDMAFMAGVYPGIAALCMMASLKCRARLSRTHDGSSGLRDARVDGAGSLVFLIRSLRVLALLQVIAWGCDIVENYSLLQWMSPGGLPISVGYFKLYHGVVALKWLIAIAGAISATGVLVRLRWLKNSRG